MNKFDKYEYEVINSNDKAKSKIGMLIYLANIGMVIGAVLFCVALFQLLRSVIK